MPRLDRRQTIAAAAIAGSITGPLVALVPTTMRWGEVHSTWEWGVAFDGWASTLVLAVLLGTGGSLAVGRAGARRERRREDFERRREVERAIDLASYDISESLLWLQAIDWENGHPGLVTEDISVPSRDWFPIYMPTLARVLSKDELRALSLIRRWVDHFMSTQTPKWSTWHGDKEHVRDAAVLLDPRMKWTEDGSSSFVQSLFRRELPSIPAP